MRRIIAALATAIAVLAVSGAAYATEPEPFPTTNWLQVGKIPASPTDPNSASWVAAMTGTRVADIYAFGKPWYQATTQTRYHVVPSQCCGDPFSAHHVPLSSSWAPATGSDGNLTVSDGTYFYEMLGYSWNGGSPTATYASLIAMNDTDANGVVTTGAGVSQAAGPITPDEFRAAATDRYAITHALVMSTSHCGSATPRYPATKTDGSHTGVAPEGALFTFKSGTDITYIDGITNHYYQAIAQAIFTYGLVEIDCGGAGIALIFEKPSNDGGDPYSAAGWADYQNLAESASGIPWSQLRVLAP